MISRLKEIRQSKAINQADLGERLGWRQQDVSKVESLDRRLDLIELFDWLEALRYEVEHFLSEVAGLKI
jgi:transcriptional regulator with XRE-family HTH domain